MTTSCSSIAQKNEGSDAPTVPTGPRRGPDDARPRERERSAGENAYRDGGRECGAEKDRATAHGGPQRLSERESLERSATREQQPERQVAERSRIDREVGDPHHK
jgi:hypothetical protein